MLAVTGPMSTHAQTGQRLYLRFNELTNNTPVDYRGMRIKRNESDDHYWVLGKSMTGQNSNGVAYIDPINPITSPPTYHTHYFAQQSPYIADIAYASDFDLNDNFTLAGAGTIEISAFRYIPSPPSGQAVSLFAVNSTPNLPLVPAGSYDYHMLGKVEVPVPCNPIKYDLSAPFGPSYAIAWNLIDPLTVGAGNLHDWGIASINAGTMAVNWSQMWAGAPANQWEDVRDLVLKPIGVGYYACCGMRKDLTTGVQSGLLTSVNRVTGVLAYQRYCTPPVGFALEFNSLTVITGPACSEYIVVGTLTSTATPPGPKRVYVASLNCAGVVNWSWALGLANGDDAEGFRHCIMPDRDIMIAGKVTHKNGAPTSGMLVKVANKTVNPDVTCATPLVRWWREYDTYDPTIPGGTNGIANVNVELIDVCPILTSSPNRYDVNNDVSAVGTANVMHAGVLIKDVLWLETTTHAVYGSGYSTDDGTSLNGQTCITNYPANNCEEIDLNVVEIAPIPKESFQTDETPMDYNPDDPFRQCDHLGSDFQAKDGQAKSGTPENDQPNSEIENTSDVSVTPIPGTDSDARINIIQSYPDNVEILVYNQTGQLVSATGPSFLKVGTHSFPLMSSSLSSGLYTIRVRSSIRTRTIIFPIVH